MSDDLVKRLGTPLIGVSVQQLFTERGEAKKRIEELEAENRRLEGEIESMRAERLERDRTTLAEITGGKDE